MWRFAVGGNGGNAAANAIQEECEAKNVVCTVVGVPKSIDNDILLVRSLLCSVLFSYSVTDSMFFATLPPVHISPVSR